MGLTLSRATGHITQLAGSWEEGTLRTEILDSPAWGIGPGVELQYDLLNLATGRLHMDLGAALQIHDRRFPAGGDHYNGLFRIGPAWSQSWGDGRSFTVGWRWMHLSNGQGPGPHNPSTEGRGLVLGAQWPL